MSRNVPQGPSIGGCVASAKVAQCADGNARPIGSGAFRELGSGFDIRYPLDRESAKQCQIHTSTSTYDFPVLLRF
jgi:hypothetical protein